MYQKETYQKKLSKTLFAKNTVIIQNNSTENNKT